MKYKTIVLLLLAAVIIAAGSGSPRLSPWDAWRMAYTSFEKGEEQRDKGEYTKARESFNKALEYYNMVRQARPDWNQKVISERIADCEKESRRMSAFLGPAATEKKEKSTQQSSRQTTAQDLKLRQELSEAKAELQELRQRNETRKNYESEISNLLRDQRILNERYSLLEKRYRAQEAKLAEPDQKRQKLEEQLVTMRLQLDLARKETAAAKQASAADAAQRNQLKRARANAEAAQRRLNGELASLRRLVNEKEGQIAALQKNISEGEKREKSFRDQFERSRTNAAALQSELNTLQSKYREKLLASGAGEAANKKLADENKRLQESLSAARKTVEENNVKSAARQRQIESLRLQLAEEVKKSAASAVDSKQNVEKLASLSKELEREKANAAIINRELESLRKNLSSYSSDLKKLNAENSELKKRLKFRDSEDFKNLTAARKERKKLSEEILKAEQAAAALKAELKISGDKMTALERSNKELRSENRKLHAEKINYEDQLKSLAGASANARELARQYSELKKNFAALQNENRQNKLAADAAKPREAELARIKLRLAELDRLKQQLSREQSFNEQLNAVKNRLDREVRQLRPMGEENAKLKTRLSDFQILKSEVERLRKLNKELAEAKKLESRVTELQLQLTKIKPEADEAGRLRRQNQELQQGKVLWDNEIAKMRLRLAAMSQLENQVKTLRQELEKRNSALREANNKINSLSAENRTLGTSVNDLETLRTRSRRLVEDQAKTLLELKNIREESLRIKRENAQLQSRIQELKRSGAVSVSSLQARNAQIAALKKEIARLKKQPLSLPPGKEGDAVKASLKEKEKVIAELKTQLAQLKKAVSDGRVSSTKANTVPDDANSSRRLAALENRLNELLRENKLLKSVNNKNVNLEQELAGARILNTRMRSELEQLRPIRSELTRLSGELKKRSDELTQVKKQNEKLLASASETSRIAQENRNIIKLNTDLANRRLKAESELASLKSELANYNRLRSETEHLRKLTTELAEAKKLEPELAQAKLQIARLEQMRDELVRQRKLNEELTRKRDALEKELASRPMPAFAPADYTPTASSKPVGKAEDYISAGRIAAADDKSELAVWNYRTALRLAPDNTEAAKLLGKLLSLRGDYAEAAPLLSRARNADPGSIDLALETAYAYIALKRYGNAAAIIEPLLKRNRENPHLQIAAAMIASGNGQYARASGLLLLAAARLPNDPQPKLELARLICNTDSRRIFEAVKLYETARRLGAPPDLELEPKLAPMLDKRRNMTNFLSSAAAEAARNKDWHSVIWYYRQLIDLDREPEKYRPRLAFAQYKKGSSGAALETLSMGRITPLGLLVKGFIHHRRNEKREAAQALAQAKRMNHNSLIEIPADWREFQLELRQNGRMLTPYIK